ncbi:dihydrodipicolinate synthase family protein [Pontibacter beigongshangensis]|uniref:dihydrodipicolinate synthase family protein n=1 Tax=Pontibacter beigongshangensis TaxID=2574733 RepID=UPI00164F1210|nr:dihydrodipicolinate synthase family protein [Pontibacter beigongshangensis]
MKTGTLPTPLKGIIPPLVTPLLDNDTLDVEGLERLIEHILAGGAHGLFVLGTTGEAPNLSYNLRHELVQRTCKQVAGRVPVLVGITDTAVSESLRLAQTAAEAGAAAVVSAPPYYYTPSQAELVTYYNYVADRVTLPLFLYNMPSHTKVSFEPATVKALSAHKNIVGLKDSSGNSVYFQMLCNIMRDQPDFSLLVGPEEITAEVVLMGGHGGVNGGANIFPHLYVELYEAALNRNFEQISILQQQVLNISSRLYTVSKCGTSYLKGVKAALSELGICNDFLAEPHQRFQGAEKEKIKSHLEEIKSSMPRVNSVSL